MKKKILWIMCGIPGSGKSFWAQHQINEHTKYVSRDAIRFSLLQDNENYFTKEKAVYAKFIEIIQMWLDEGYDVIADATHINWASRKKLLDSLRLDDTDINIVWMKTRLDTCLARNSEREGRSYVPETAIIDMNRRKQHPIKDPVHYANIWNIEENMGEVIIT